MIIQLPITSGVRPRTPPNVTMTPELDLADWYTIRRGLSLIMSALRTEGTGDCEYLERDRIEECISIENLQRRVAQLIAVQEKELGVTPSP